MPWFSVITPVFDPPEAVLRAMIHSIRSQSFTDWELCLVDDCSTRPHVRPILDEAAAADDRIRVVYREANGGIVAASNDALAMATGEFVALVDHDDELHLEALERVDEAIASQPDVDYVYTDEDKIDERGRSGDTFLKPDWSPERLRTQMYTCHLSVLRRSLVEEVGRFRDEFNGSQDWDLVFRITERARAVVHVPAVLYHWRALPSSAAGAGEAAKPWAYEAGTRAIQAHCDRTGVAAVAVHDSDHPGIYHLQPRVADPGPISIVIPTAGQRRDVRGEYLVLVERCVASIVTRSTYKDFEILCVIDDRTDRHVVETVKGMAAGRLRVVECTGPFNYSERINAGALAADGDHLLLLNDDVEVITPDWLEHMVMYSQLPGVGAVGAKLHFGDGCLQHAGVVFNEVGPGHIYRNFPGDYGGYFNMLKVANNFQAVTGACLMTRRDLFEEVGGLSTLLPLNFNDIDYCLKVREQGQRIVLDPDTVLFHYESSSRETEVAEWEIRLLQDRHAGIVPDPFYNPGLLPSLTYMAPITLVDSRSLG